MENSRVNEKEINSLLKSTVMTQSAEEYLRDQNLMLMISLQLEGAKQAARELREENKKLETIVDVLKESVELYLETFEQIFECDEASFDRYNAMEKYVKVAEYMAGRYGRKSPVIDRVKARMNQLPF